MSMSMSSTLSVTFPIYEPVIDEFLPEFTPIQELHNGKFGRVLVIQQKRTSERQVIKFLNKFDKKNQKVSQVFIYLFIYLYIDKIFIYNKNTISITIKILN